MPCQQCHPLCTRIYFISSLLFNISLVSLSGLPRQVAARGQDPEACCHQLLLSSQPGRLQIHYSNRREGGRDPLSFFTFECTGFLIASAMVTQAPGPEFTQLTTSVPDLLPHTAPRGEGSIWGPGVGPGRSKGIQLGL